MSTRSAFCWALALAWAVVCQTAAWATDVAVATASADYGTGSIAVLRDGAATAEANLLNIHSDAVVRYHQGTIYIINRTGQDNILLLDPQSPRVPKNQYSVGNGTNPQDIVVLGEGKAYVTLYERDFVLILDPRSGAELGRIDLSGFADADGLPEASEMARVGDRVFVAIQRMYRKDAWDWQPAGDSYLAVIDTNTDALVDVDPAASGTQGVRLAATNPGSLRALKGQVFVQEVGSYMALDGGIEVVDAARLTASGLLITEEQLGGACGGLAMASPTRGYTTSSVWPSYSVLPFDLGTRTVGPALQGHSGGYTPSLAVDGDRLLVADRGTEDDLDAAGLLVFDAATGAKLAGPISTGLPPSSIAVLADPVPYTAVTDEASAGGGALPLAIRLGDAYPNPFNGGTQIPFSVAQAQPGASLLVRDALGQLVRTFPLGSLAAGDRALLWDGRDDAGRPVGNGAYLVELRAGQSLQVAKVMLLK